VGGNVGSVSTVRKRWSFALLAAAIPLVPIIVGAIIASPSGNASRTAGLTFTSVGHENQSKRPRASASVQGHGAIVALIEHQTVIRDTPGGRVLTKLPTRTEFGSPQALWVVAHRGSWLGVISPLVGNHRTGWITRSVTTLTRVPWELQVSLSARRLTVLHEGHAVRRYAIAIGRSDAPTPTGRFAVTDRLSTGNPAGPYGCCILALSANSPHAIQGWTGGNRIAIHSTPETSSIGEAVSHGCVRVTLAEGRWLLGHVPLGTPTLIGT
jgi:lipoprotein-anchoring transpeptidase ErfK/SrfK